MMKYYLSDHDLDLLSALDCLIRDINCIFSIRVVYY